MQQSEPQTKVHCVVFVTMRMSSGVAIATSVSARSEPNALYAHDRTDRMNFTAPMPLFATRMLHRSNIKLCLPSQAHDTPNAEVLTARAVAVRPQSAALWLMRPAWPDHLLQGLHAAQRPSGRLPRALVHACLDAV
jgi:hypothetical protein